MHNPSVFGHQRNKTLPLKTNTQIRSANKIKISMKGLPRDFFQHDPPQAFSRSKKIRCKTQVCRNELEETSYFQYSESLSPKKEGREYKSEQRRQVYCEPERSLKTEGDCSANLNVLDCTFFKSVALESKERSVSGGYLYSGRIPRKASRKPTGQQVADLDSELSQQDINSIFKPRECVNLSRLRPRLHKGLPLIRLCRPTYK